MAETSTTPVTPAAPQTTQTSAPKPSEPQKTEVKAEPKKVPPEFTETKSEKSETPDWTDEDSKTFESLLKRRNVKLKMRQEEAPISSLEDFQKAIQLAQRGLGGARQAGEFRKKEEEYQAKLKAHEEKEALLEAARSGDYEARKALGLVSKKEEAERRKEYEEIPEEVRELLEQRNTYAQELAKVKAERERELQLAKESEERAFFEETRKAVLSEADRVLRALEISPENAEEFLPYVSGAIADLSASGLVLGEDMTTEMIVSRAKQLHVGQTEKFFSRLDRKTQIKHITQVLNMLTDDEFGLIPDETQLKIAKQYAQKLKKAKAKDSPPVVLAKDTKPEKKQEIPKVLTFAGPRYR